MLFELKIFILLFKIYGISLENIFIKICLRIFFIYICVTIFLASHSIFRMDIDGKFSILMLFRSIEQILHCVFVMIIYLMFLKKEKELKKLVKMLRKFDEKFEIVFVEKMNLNELKIEIFGFFAYSVFLHFLLFIISSLRYGIYFTTLLFINYQFYSMIFHFISVLIALILMRFDKLMNISKLLIIKRDILENLHDELMEIYNFIRKKFQIFYLICFRKFL